jgi:hypothetical protein
MGLAVLPAPIPRMVFVVASLLASSGLFAPVASAQRAGARIPVPARIVAPRAVSRISPPPISRPRVLPGPHQVGINNPAFGFRRRPIYVFRHPVFFVVPYLPFDESLWFESYARLNCTSYWRSGLGCNGLPLDENGFENYVTHPAFENSFYSYGEERRDLVQLFLKDSEAYSVADYWFVNGKLHFLTADEGAEQVVDSDELDYQKTAAVNTRRGFRVVMRDEPWEQYLRDHPDVTPPLLAPPAPQKN